MAVGFAMSQVHSIEYDDEEKALLFDLRAIRYKIVIDDLHMAQKLIEMLQKLTADAPKEKKKIRLPDFYVDKKPEDIL